MDVDPIYFVDDATLVGKSRKSSLFPAQIAFGATWNRDLLYDVAVAADNDSRIPVSTTALESSPAPRGAQCERCVKSLWRNASDRPFSLALTGTNLGLNRSADPTLSPRSTAVRTVTCRPSMSKSPRQKFLDNEQEYLRVVWLS